MTVLAHAGHWLSSLLYVAPLVVLLGWMGVVRLKDSRARRRADDA